MGQMSCKWNMELENPRKPGAALEMGSVASTLTQELEQDRCTCLIYKYEFWQGLNTLFIKVNENHLH